MIIEWFKFVEKHPLEFTIQYPPRREYFKENFLHEPVKNIFSNKKELLLYIHIPFCEQKCYYCNFSVDTRKSEELFKNYTNSLIKEIDNHYYLLNNNIQFTGIDIGGGTPTALSSENLENILDKLKPFKLTSNHLFPTSIETTPSIAAKDLEKIIMLAKKGVDRISMGIQSFSSTNLLEINRENQISQNNKAVENIKKAKFKRFNIDLIFALPHQTMEDWKNDLENVLSLLPDSITIYDCLYRGKGRVLTKKTIELPSLSTYGEMYDLGYEFLTSNGYYSNYGSVNFSRIPNETGTSANFEARLLDGKPYFGIGNYASSLVDNYWYFNVYSVNEYIKMINSNKSPIGDFYSLPSEEMYAKYILYSLNYGIIDELRFFKRFNKNFSEIFKNELDFMQEHNWLYKDKNIWKISKGNFKNINFIRSLFYSNSAKNWLINLF